MPAAIYEICIEQGTDLYLPIQIKVGGVPIDLIDSSFASQIRRSPADPNPAATFEITFPDMTGGILALKLPADITASLGAGKYFYDLEWTNPSGTVTKLLKGPVYVEPEITK